MIGSTFSCTSSIAAKYCGNSSFISPISACVMNKRIGGHQPLQLQAHYEPLSRYRIKFRAECLDKWIQSITFTETLLEILLLSEPPRPVRQSNELFGLIRFTWPQTTNKGTKERSRAQEDNGNDKSNKRAENHERENKTDPTRGAATTTENGRPGKRRRATSYNPNGARHEPRHGARHGHVILAVTRQKACRQHAISV